MAKQNPKNLSDALALIAELRSQVAKYERGRGNSVQDKYTEMDAAELRALVIKLKGDPDDIAHGYHSRGRSNALRNWLREQEGERGAKRRLSAREVEKIASGKKPATKAKSGNKGPPPKKMTEKEAAAQHKRNSAAIRNADLGHGKPKKAAPAKVKSKKEEKPRVRVRAGRSMA